MNAIINSVTNAQAAPNFPGTVTAELTGALINVLPINHCIT
jgi:hypothetical protein